MDSLPDMELYSGPDNPFPSGPNAATKCFEISGTWARLCIVLGWSEEQVIEARAILSGWVYPLSYENLFSGGNVSGDLVWFTIVGRINVNLVIEDLGTLYSYAPSNLSGNYNKVTGEWDVNYTPYQY